MTRTRKKKRHKKQKPDDRALFISQKEKAAKADEKRINVHLVKPAYELFCGPIHIDDGSQPQAHDEAARGELRHLT